MQRDEFPIRKKTSKVGKTSRETFLSNMVALTIEGCRGFNDNLTNDIKGAE
jgi:hypothetical protein